MFYFQVYLVTGGYIFSQDASVYTDTTEIMIAEETGWNIIQDHPLPYKMSMGRSISINNKVFLIGNGFGEIPLYTQFVCTL